MPRSFPGFPQAGIRFLRNLKKNNNREWFNDNKAIFESSVKEPMVDLVAAINEHLVQFAPHWVTEPKKAVYRIYRDTRFSSDKTPYKTHAAANFFRAGLEKHAHPGYYFSVSPDTIEVAGGLYMPDADGLRAVRTHLLDRHEEFRKIAVERKLVANMGSLYGESLSRTPKGFPVGHPADDVVRCKQWLFYDTRMAPTLATTPQLLPELVKRFKLLTPLILFLDKPLRDSKRIDPLTVQL